jgi:hypothetical protein
MYVETNILFKIALCEQWRKYEYKNIDNENIRFPIARN